MNSASKEESTSLLLKHNDVVATLRNVGLDRFMRELIDELDVAMRNYARGEYDVPARTGFHYRVPATGLIEWMPLHRRGQAVFMKSVGYHPENPRSSGRPTINAVLHSFDACSGDFSQWWMGRC